MQKKNQTPVDLVTVAKVAGVSTATVSRVVNNLDNVSDATRQRVRKAIEDTGYVPNRIAGGLAARRTGLIAVIVPSLLHSVLSDTVQAMAQELARAGYQVMLGLSGYDALQVGNMFESVLSRRPDGVILTAFPDAPRIRKRVEAMGIPVIETWEIPSRPLDLAVGFSHNGVGADIADFLAARGYRRAAIVSADSPRAITRRDAFCRRMVDLGLPEPRRETVSMPSTVAHGRDATLRLLGNQRQAPEVIVCSSDWLALGCMIEAKGKGLSIPQDLGVFGFGNLDFSVDLDPPLTTVHVDGAEIGRRVVQLLAQRSQGMTIRQRLVEVPVNIVERLSCRPLQTAPLQRNTRS
jgi:LacI family gluconate utilization system Gnt-I transcriptional repressor